MSLVLSKSYLKMIQNVVENQIHYTIEKLDKIGRCEESSEETVHNLVKMCVKEKNSLTCIEPKNSNIIFCNNCLRASWNIT